MSGITVGIDGSSHSACALEWALKEAAITHARLTVLTVHSVAVSGWSGNPILLPGDVDDQEKAYQGAEEMTLKAIAQLGQAQPPPVTVRVVTGFPAEELIKASNDADLLVVGSHGAGGIARMIMGSVSNQVVRHAHCPVVVVR
jgi:nucleotide-binding universal stress UspA family protein